MSEHVFDFDLRCYGTAKDLAAMRKKIADLCEADKLKEFSIFSEFPDFDTESEGIPFLITFEEYRGYMWWDARGHKKFAKLVSAFPKIIFIAFGFGDEYRPEDANGYCYLLAAKGKILAQQIEFFPNSDFEDEDDPEAVSEDALFLGAYSPDEASEKYACQRGNSSFDYSLNLADLNLKPYLADIVAFMKDYWFEESVNVKIDAVGTAADIKKLWSALSKPNDFGITLDKKKITAGDHAEFKMSFMPFRILAREFFSRFPTLNIFIFAVSDDRRKFGYFLSYQGKLASYEVYASLMGEDPWDEDTLQNYYEKWRQSLKDGDYFEEDE
jgi:hypothetical protein